MSQTASPLLRHVPVAWGYLIHYDSMHTFGAIIKDVCVKSLLGLRFTENVQAAEQKLGRYTSAPLLLPPEGVQEFTRRLSVQASQLPSATGAGRLRTVVSRAHTTKTHTYCLLASPLGFNALFSVMPYVHEPMALLAVIRLMQTIHIMSSKELDHRSYPFLFRMLVEAISMVELYLPVTERDFKLHMMMELFHKIVCWGGL